MCKLPYLVSTAIIAIMVAALANPAGAQPFSETMGSWGYGGYRAFRTVLWVIILIALIFGIIWRVRSGKHRSASEGRSDALHGLEKKQNS